MTQQQSGGDESGATSLGWPAVASQRRHTGTNEGQSELNTLLKDILVGSVEAVDGGLCKLTGQVSAPTSPVGSSRPKQKHLTAQHVATLGGRLEKLLDAVRVGFARVFAEAFADAAERIVTAGGVERVSADVGACADRLQYRRLTDSKRRAACVSSR
jgi:hypothetical protein